MADQILDHGFECSCGHCGHVDNFDLFTSTPINGDLPTGHYQCPSCQKAWKVGQSSPDTYVEVNGRTLRVPGDRKIESVGSVL